MSQAETPKTDAPKKKSKLVPILAATAVVLLLGGGGAAYWVYAHRPPAEGEAEPEPEHIESGIVPFDTFVVNLADPGGRRFLRVKLTLVVEGEEAAKEIAESEVELMRVRSAILELLTQQTADHLTTADGKSELKTAIAEGATHVLEHVKVIDVLFTEFVVQYRHAAPQSGAARRCDVPRRRGARHRHDDGA